MFKNFELFKVLIPARTFLRNAENGHFDRKVEKETQPKCKTEINRYTRRKTKLLIVTSRHNKAFIGRRSSERKVQWDIRDGSEPFRATKSER